MEYYFPEEALGIKTPRNFIKLGALIRKGFSFSCVIRFQELSGASDDEVRHILWLKDIDFKARKRARRLSAQESDRLFSAAKYLAYVYGHFRAKNKCKDDVVLFLHNPIGPDLPLPPIRLLGTEAGIEMANTVLSGVYRRNYLLKQLPKTSLP